MKKIASVLLLFALLFSCLNGVVMTAGAVDQPEAQTVPNGLSYAISDGEVTITGYTGSAAEVVIPGTIEGCPVTSIGCFAFYECKTLTGITLPDSLTCIESSAFNGCTNLTDITIPDGVAGIGAWAFRSCDSLTDISIPDSVTYLGDFVFHYCSNLTSVTIGDGVTGIGFSAFFRCTNLTRVTIGNSVAIIGESAFDGCSSLTDITLGSSITTIDYSAFANCSGLTSVVIPDGVTSIGNYAFDVCSSMTDIAIPGSVTSIGEGAFYGCRQLETVLYAGSEAQWQAIAIDNFNPYLTSANIIFNYNIDNGKVDKWNVILKDDIGVNFQMEFPEKIQSDEDAYVEISVADTVTNVPVSQAMDGILADIAPVQMTEPIHVCVVAGDGSRSMTSVYSVKAYGEKILSGDYDDATKNVVREMLHYGAMAQQYFGCNTDNLANEGIADAAAQAVPETTVKLSASGDLNSLTLYGTSLVYRNKIAVRFYFTGDVTGLTFLAGDNTCSPVAKDGMCYIEIADILPQNLDQPITLTATDGSKVLSVTYSPMDYIVRMNEKGDTNTKNLLKALYNYHLAAQALTV